MSTFHSDRRQAPPLLTVAEAAERLRVSTKTIRRQIAAGTLAAHRIGRSVRIAEPDLVQLLRISRG